MLMKIVKKIHNVHISKLSQIRHAKKFYKMENLVTL
jgi:hypothetical protein